MVYNKFLKKSIWLFFISLSISSLFSETVIVEPDKTKEPEVKDKFENTDEESYFYLDYQYQNGIYEKGLMDKKENVYLNLQWKGNENMDQQILLDLVKSIRVKGYTMEKRVKQDLGIVFYFPYLFDIEMKDGKEIKDAKGRIKELEQFSIYNSLGKKKCYSYFIRYWLEDKKIFNDNQSADYYESPKVPESVIIYLEFKKK